MPQLSKKGFIKPAVKTRKPLNASLPGKENYPKKLKPTPNKDSAKKPFVQPVKKRSDHVPPKTFSGFAQKKNKSGKEVLSKHVSFKEENMDDASSDISARMNEPETKQAYLQFVQNLSQSSNSEVASLLAESQQLIENIEDLYSDVQPDTEQSLNMYGSYADVKFTEDEAAMSLKSQTSEQHTVKNTDRDNICREAQLSTKTNEKASLDSGFVSTQDNLKTEMGENVHLEHKAISLEGESLKKKQPAKKIKKIKEKQNSLKGQKVFLEQKATSVAGESMKKKKPTEKIKIVTEKENNLKEDKDRRINETTKKTVNGDKFHTVELFNKDPKNEKNKVPNENRIKNDLKLKGDIDNSTSPYEKMLIIQESRNVGLYVLCDNCDKARYLPHIKDPLDLPEKWYCSMNPDETHNTCDKIEEIEEEDKEFLIDNLFNAGSIVWAKMDGFPWWPAMVEDDPDFEQYYWLDENITEPTFYHVTFFDYDDVTRAWIRPTFLKPFKINMTNPAFLISKCNKFKSRVDFAFKQATDAVNLPLLERLRKYSFIQRYTKPLNNLKPRRVKTKKAVLDKPERKSKKLAKHVKTVRKNCKKINTLRTSTSGGGDGISIILDNLDLQNLDNLSISLLQ